MHRFQTLLRTFKGDARHLPRIIVLTILSIGVYNFGWGFADPFFSLYLSQFTDQYTVIGFLSALMSVVMIVITLVIGPLLDRCRHQTVIDIAKVGYFFVGLCYFLAGEWSSMPLVLTAIILNGAMVPFVWTGTLATLEEYSDEKDATLTFGLYATVRQIFWGLGLAIALWVVWEFPLHYIYIPVMIFPLISMLITKNVKEKKTQPFFLALKAVFVEDRVVRSTFREVREFSRELGCAYLLNFLTYTIYMVGMIYLPLYAISTGYTIVESGMLVLVMSIPFFASFLTAEIADHSERFRNIIFGLLISSGAIVAIGLWGEGSALHLYGWAFVFMAGFAIIEPSLSAIITMLTPKKESGVGSAMRDLTLYVGIMIFSPLLGFLTDTFGWERAFFACGGFFLVVVIITVAIRANFRKKDLLYRLHHPHGKHNPYVL